MQLPRRAPPVADLVLVRRCYAELINGTFYERKEPQPSRRFRDAFATRPHYHWTMYSPCRRSNSLAIIVGVVPHASDDLPSCSTNWLHRPHCIHYLVHCLRMAAQRV